MSSTERYRLVRTVASGGMAQVVEAVARGIDGFERRVAIKRLLPQHARDGERRRMFLEEARIGSRLHHGGIVPIFDYGLIDGSEFLAMEFVDGLDALRAVSGGAEVAAMPEGIALHIAAEVGHALAYIHDLRDDTGKPLGIIHRDVSPPNILLSWDGDVKLSDFGIALSGWREERSVGGLVKGKLHYMAPEQALGKRVTAAADVYALGATLDALLGGQAMVPAMTDEETARRVQQARDRGVSPAVCALIGACLARDPARRPRAGEVAARAGALASRRLGRDGRGALRAWLQPLRPRSKQQSALDDLMGLCLVPVGPEGARTFTVSQVWQPQKKGAGAGADAASQETPPPELVDLRPKRRMGRGGAVTAGVLVAAAAIWGGMHARGSFSALVPPGSRSASGGSISDTLGAPVQPSVAAAPAAPVAAPPSAPVAAKPQALSAAPAAGPVRVLAMATTPRLAATGPVERPRGDDSPRPRRLVATRSRAAAPVAHEPREAAPAASDDAGKHGWLRVGGPTFAGQRVAVDGATAGFAPLETALPAGQHVITVIDPGSEHVLLRKAVHIGEHHTRVAPLQILK